MKLREFVVSATKASEVDESMEKHLLFKCMPAPILPTANGQKTFEVLGGSGGWALSMPEWSAIFEELDSWGFGRDEGDFVISLRGARRDRL